MGSRISVHKNKDSDTISDFESTDSSNSDDSLLPVGNRIHPLARVPPRSSTRSRRGQAAPQLLRPHTVHRFDIYRQRFGVVIPAPPPRARTSIQGRKVARPHFPPSAKRMSFTPRSTTSSLSTVSQSLPPLGHRVRTQIGSRGGDGCVSRLGTPLAKKSVSSSFKKSPYTKTLSSFLSGKSHCMEYDLRWLKYMEILLNPLSLYQYLNPLLCEELCICTKNRWTDGHARLWYLTSETKGVWIYPGVSVCMDSHEPFPLCVPFLKVTLCLRLAFKLVPEFRIWYLQYKVPYISGQTST